MTPLKAKQQKTHEQTSPSIRPLNDPFVFASTYPYFLSSHTSVHNSKTVPPSLKHKKKHRKFDILSNSYNSLIEIRICLFNGDVRFEHLCLPLPFSPNPAEFELSVTYLDNRTDFCGYLSFLFGVPIKVAGWNVEECRIDVLVKNGDQITSGGVQALWAEESFLEHNKENVYCLLYLTDYFCRTEEDGYPNIEKISISQFEPKYQERIAPHKGTSVSIQNLCGFCNLPYEISFRSFYPVSKKSKRTLEIIIEAQRQSFYANPMGLCDEDMTEDIGISPENHPGRCESLVMLSGTFKLCSNCTRIDFRGVRSVSLIREDWETISGIPIDSVSMYVYMVVLKGNLGKSLFFRQMDISCFSSYQSPNSKHHIVDLTHGGPNKCFLTNGIWEWCQSSIHLEDVCEVLCIDSINWDVFLAKYPSVPISDMTRNAESMNINISRRGGTIIRLTFPQKTMWNALHEHEVVSDCNKILNVLYDVAHGRCYV